MIEKVHEGGLYIFMDNLKVYKEIWSVDEKDEPRKKT